MPNGVPCRGKPFFSRIFGDAPLFLKRRNRILRKWRWQGTGYGKGRVPDTLRRSVCGPARPLPNWCGRVRFRSPPWNLPSAKTPDTGNDLTPGRRSRLPAVAYIPPPSMTKGVRPWCIQHAGRGMYGAAVALGFHPWRWPRSGVGATGCGFMAPCGFAAERAAWGWPFRFSPLAGASVRLLPSSAGRVSYPIQYSERDRKCSCPHYVPLSYAAAAAPASGPSPGLCIPSSLWIWEGIPCSAIRWIGRRLCRTAPIRWWSAMKSTAFMWRRPCSRKAYPGLFCWSPRDGIPRPPLRWRRSRRCPAATIRCCWCCRPIMC